MKDNELQLLATHLGHDVTTHRGYYRLSSSTMELTKVFILAVDVIVILKYFIIMINKFL